MFKLDQPNQAHRSNLLYRPDIDGLRCIALVAIYLFHAFPTTFKGGFIGVDIFFVITGFLISSIIFSQLEKGTFSFLDFYSRRIRRIYPSLITILILTLGVSIVFYYGYNIILSNELNEIGKHVLAGATYVSNFVLWNESSYFDSEAITKPLLHLWSLGIEAQFYLCWPFVLWFAWKKKLNFFYVATFLAIASFIFNLYLYKTDPTADFYSPLASAWELLCGAMLAYLTLHPEFIEKSKLKFIVAPKYKEHIFSSLGIFFFIASLLIVKTTSARFYPGAWALLPIFSATFFIMAGPNGWFNKYILSNKVLVWFGLISYQTYLFQWPFLSFGQIYYRHITTYDYRIASFVISIILAYLTTRFIEKPFRFGQNAKAKTIGLLIAMFAVSVIAFIVYKKVSPNPQYVTLQAIHKKNFQNNPGLLNACYNDGFKNKFKGCEYTYKQTNKPNVLIWGDSHVAHLMPGLIKYYGDKVNLVQRTHPGRLPTITSPDWEYILKETIEQQPHAIILDGRWIRHEPTAILDLEKAVKAFQKNNFKRIILMGVEPEWQMRLPKLLILNHHKTGAFEHRLKTDALNFHRTHLELSQKTKQWGITYIPIVDKLCTKEGCLTYLNDDVEQILYFDEHHFTKVGSEYVFSLIAKESTLTKALSLP